ncbi:hypothetical protein SELMODRAFT_402004 [Selaginella moellendorffii]|uniref:Uncharacterized protein n=1 Tax=Selaginella moellendorffii TaxID=88036 RepID=D8QPA0_SELML|nr:hypothetical protein SELMODRAFT_402004 [Selaginella moellendorffii]
MAFATCTLRLCQVNERSLFTLRDEQEDEDKAKTAILSKLVDVILMRRTDQVLMSMLCQRELKQGLKKLLQMAMVGCGEDVDTEFKKDAQEVVKEAYKVMELTILELVVLQHAMAVDWKGISRKIVKFCSGSADLRLQQILQVQLK